MVARRALEEFKGFVLRGNVVELAVAVAIGAAFGSVVTSFTENLLTPLLAIPGTAADFGDLTFTLGGSVFAYGLVVNAVISFVLTAAVIFFAVVRPLNRLADRRRRPAPEPATRDCPECLSTIPKAARRCPACTSVVTPMTPDPEPPS